MHKKATFAAIILGVLIILGIIVFVKSLNDLDGQIACTLEAKICPDGTAVGRSGPRCEFTECPIVKTGTKAKINEKILNNGIYITPLVVLEDSRCPTDVVCIQAGTVRVKVLLQLNSDMAQEEISIRNTAGFLGRTIELLDVSPSTHSQKAIMDADYVFEFSVK